VYYSGGRYLYSQVLGDGLLLRDLRDRLGGVEPHQILDGGLPFLCINTFRVAGY